MRISNDTWMKYRIKYGDNLARRMLKSMTRPDKQDARIQTNKSPDPLTRIMSLVHEWPSSTPAENRLRFAVLIRSLVQRSRAQRERILGYCSPGVPRQLLP